MPENVDEPGEWSHQLAGCDVKESDRWPLLFDNYGKQIASLVDVRSGSKTVVVNVNFGSI